MGLRQSKRKAICRAGNNTEKCSVQNEVDDCYTPTIDFESDFNAEKNGDINVDIESSSNGSLVSFGNESPTFDDILFSSDIELIQDSVYQSSLEDLGTFGNVDKKETWRHTLDIGNLYNTKPARYGSVTNEETLKCSEKNHGYSTWPRFASEGLFLPNYLMDVQRIGQYEVLLCDSSFICFNKMYQVLKWDAKICDTLMTSLLWLLALSVTSALDGIIVMVVSPVLHVCHR